MPLTLFQREVFATLRRHRSPDSFVFGATVLNTAANTPRFSRDNLALSGRAGPRDFVDAIHLHKTYLSPGTLAWAADGKDGGLNPRMILDLAKRFARYRQEEIDALHLNAPLSLPELKAKWSDALEEGRRLIDRLRALDAGCAWLDPVSGKAVNPEPDSASFASLCRHFGSTGGAWPALCAGS